MARGTDTCLPDASRPEKWNIHPLGITGQLPALKLTASVAGPRSAPPEARHRPAAVGLQTPIERLQRRLGPPGRLPAGRGPVAPALRSR
jgi:hypothetical protein